jgi:hypothetical protein
MADVKERPILFSAPMVRAILAGTKSQTRRIVKLPDGHTEFYVDPGGTVFGPGPYLRFPATETQIGHGRIRCPYGYPGDRLWAKETHAIRTDVDPKIDLAKARQYLIYRADHDGDLGMEWHSYGRWRPSIHMPRWASRITLEIVEVRVQRLQAISGDDARDEGISDEDTRCDGECGATPCSMLVPAYQRLWCAINGADSWAANPWVWALTFKRIDLGITDDAAARAVAREVRDSIEPSGVRLKGQP